MDKPMTSDGSYIFEKVCFNCNYFFTYPMYEATEYGICLNDETFEPHMDALFEDDIDSTLKRLLEQKKFMGQHEACADFDLVEVVEIDDATNNPLGQELLYLKNTGQLNQQTMETALHKALERQVENIDWNTIPVDTYATQLQSNNSIKRDEAIANFFGLMALGNTNALDALFNYFIKLPPPGSISEVHYKIDFLRKLSGRGKDNALFPYLIEELYNTPSNNTTRQWISAIFGFIGSFPSERIKEPLEKMLKDNRFSYRLKKKIKGILSHQSNAY